MKMSKQPTTPTEVLMATGKLQLGHPFISMCSVSHPEYNKVFQASLLTITSESSAYTMSLVGPEDGVIQKLDSMQFRMRSRVHFGSSPYDIEFITIVPLFNKDCIYEIRDLVINRKFESANSNLSAYLSHGASLQEKPIFQKSQTLDNHYAALINKAYQSVVRNEPKSQAAEPKITKILTHTVKLVRQFDLDPDE